MTRTEIIEALTEADKTHSAVKVEIDGHMDVYFGNVAYMNDNYVIIAYHNYDDEIDYDEITDLVII